MSLQALMHIRPMMGNRESIVQIVRYVLTESPISIEEQLDRMGMAAIENLDCLAKLVKAGFRSEPTTGTLTALENHFATRFRRSLVLEVEVIKGEAPSTGSETPASWATIGDLDVDGREYGITAIVTQWETVKVYCRQLHP